jgi:hypothetical protein
MNLKSLTVLPLLVLGLAVQGIAGRYAGDFLDIEIGGRALGMGGAYVSLSGDCSGPFFNPAGLGRLTEREVSFMHSWLYMGMASHDFFGFVTPLGAGTGAGISVIRLGVDEIPIFAELEGTPEERRQDPQLRPDGQPQGYFGDSEYAGCLSLAKAIIHEFGEDVEYVAVPLMISIGGNLKYVHQSILDNTGTGIGVDFGLILGLELGDLLAKSSLGELSAGLSLMDVGGTGITWDTSSKRADEIPSNLRVGLSYVQEIQPLAGALTLSVQSDSRYERKVSFGAEYSLLERVAVRAGYTGDDLTLGAGVSAPYNFNLDYAFVNHGIDNTHRVCLGVSF